MVHHFSLRRKTSWHKRPKNGPFQRGFFLFVNTLSKAYAWLMDQMMTFPILHDFTLLLLISKVSYWKKVEKTSLKRAIFRPLVPTGFSTERKMMYHFEIRMKNSPYDELDRRIPDFWITLILHISIFTYFWRHWAIFLINWSSYFLIHFGCFQHKIIFISHREFLCNPFFIDGLLKKPFRQICPTFYNKKYIICLFFSAYDFWMFMPIVGPHLGAIVGSLFYDLFIGFHWPVVQNENEINLDKINWIKMHLHSSLATLFLMMIAIIAKSYL